jgi:acyl-CoA thioester hydrolase
MNHNHVFESNVDVRFNDIDAMGHVNNAVILTYFEEGRKALFLNKNMVSIPDAFNFILAHIECDYLLPVRLADNLSVRLWVSDIGKKSFSLAYALVDAGDEKRLFAKGSSVQVCYDYQRRRSMPVPEDLRTALGAYLSPS